MDTNENEHQAAAQEAHHYDARDEEVAEGQGITQRVSCDRCRRRKIKCNRVNPCDNCIKFKAQCTFDHGQKPRPKRQRVIVSSLYESRMEYIQNRVNDLTEMVSRLSESNRNAASNNASATHSETSAASQSLSNVSTRTVSENDGIETSLFSHAVFAVKVLNAAIANDPASTTAAEMSDALDALQEAITTQDQRNESHERSPPFSTSLQPSQCLADLPHPPLDKIFACLAIAQVKVCSPGPTTDAELIIVYAGLYWLFSECSAATTSDSVRQEYVGLGRMCQENLETVLSQLSFFLPPTIDSVYALYLASIYCLQSRRPTITWTFISRASLTAQTLRLHDRFSMVSDSLQEKLWKTSLFWAVYDIEKPSSLRAGVSSTIRDQEITVPRPQPENTKYRALPTNISGCARLSSIYGRVYDELYSPSATLLPATVRVSRARTLAAEMNRVSDTNFGKHDSPDSARRTLDNLSMPKLLDYMLKTSNLSVLALILRIIPSDARPSSAPSLECLSIAKAALEQHQSCVAMLNEHDFHSATIDIWLNGGLIMSPFIPFTIIFCNIVERTDPADLEFLGQFASDFERLSQLPRFALHARQARIFKLLYDVASKYIAVRSKTHDEEGQDAVMAAFDFDAYSSSHFSNNFSMALPSPSGVPSWNVEANCSQSDSQLPQADLTVFMDGKPQSETYGAEATTTNPSSFEASLEGAQLSNWFYQTQQMMNFGDM